MTTPPSCEWFLFSAIFAPLATPLTGAAVTSRKAAPPPAAFAAGARAAEVREQRGGREGREVGLMRLGAVRYRTPDTGAYREPCSLLWLFLLICSVPPRLVAAFGASVEAVQDLPCLAEFFWRTAYLVNSL